MKTTEQLDSLAARIGAALVGHIDGDSFPESLLDTFRDAVSTYHNRLQRLRDRFPLGSRHVIAFDPNAGVWDARVSNVDLEGSVTVRYWVGTEAEAEDWHGTLEDLDAMVRLAGPLE
jgi:hypothetical protein